jgi:hypothetical protein
MSVAFHDNAKRTLHVRGHQVMDDMLWQGTVNGIVVPESEADLELEFKENYLGNPVIVQVRTAFTIAEDTVAGPSHYETLLRIETDLERPFGIDVQNTKAPQKAGPGGTGGGTEAMHFNGPFLGDPGEPPAGSFIGWKRYTQSTDTIKEGGGLKYISKGATEVTMDPESNYGGYTNGADLCVAVFRSVAPPPAYGMAVQSIAWDDSAKPFNLSVVEKANEAIYASAGRRTRLYYLLAGHITEVTAAAVELHNHFKIQKEAPALVQGVSSLG